MVSRFVAVPVVIPFEECIQTFGEAFFSAYMFDQPGYVLRNVPSIVVGCAFANEECERERVERFDPASVGMASTGIAGFGVDYVPVVSRPFDERIIIDCLA